MLPLRPFKDALQLLDDLLPLGVPFGPADQEVVHVPSDLAVLLSGVLVDERPHARVGVESTASKLRQCRVASVVPLGGGLTQSVRRLEELSVRIASSPQHACQLWN